MTTLVELKAVHKSYWRGPREIRVLRGIDLTLGAGEFLAIWGSRGAGKSTLALLAAGLERPDGGIVSFAGNDLAALSRKAVGQVRTEIGWANRKGPDDHELTMLEYLAIPLLLKGHTPRYAERAAADVLAQNGLGGCEHKLWAELTDAERTLVAITRALARHPRLLVVDDPTANLDGDERMAVMGLLRDRADRDGLAVLVTVPDMPDLLTAGRIATLSDGRLLFPTERLDKAAEVIDLGARRNSA